METGVFNTLLEASTPTVAAGQQSDCGCENEEMKVTQLPSAI